MTSMVPQAADGKTRGALVQLLKTEGPMTSAQLAQRLGLTAMAIRQHLYALQTEKFVQVEERPVPIGRPVKYWQLTPAADQLFPNAYAELNVSLLNAVGDAFGSPGLEKILEIRSARQQASYSEQITPTASLKQKLQQLASLRTAEGYMAEVHAEKKGSFLLLENHCPICVAARQCQGFCQTELDLFRKVLGPDVEVERLEHIVSGARRCAYRVKRLA